LSAGAPSQTQLGEVTALPQTSSWILGAYFEGEGEVTREQGVERRVEKGAGKGKGKERDGKGRDGERRGRVGPKLKLGPQNYFPGAGAVESE